MTISHLEYLLELEAKATPDWRYEAERYSARDVVGCAGEDRWVATFQPAFNGTTNAQLAVALRNSARALILEAIAARKFLSLVSSLLSEDEMREAASCYAISPAVYEAQDAYRALVEGGAE